MIAKIGAEPTWNRKSASLLGRYRTPPGVLSTSVHSAVPRRPVIAAGA
jgi:hypothetical protein